MEAQKINVNGVIVGLKMEDGSVTTPKIVDKAVTKAKLSDEVQESLDKADSAYQKPSAGIPGTDLTEGVQTSLGKADTSLQPSDIVDNLDSADSTRALSAKQGGHLVDYIDQSISSTTAYVDQQDNAERAGRVAGDEILDGKIAAINGKIPSQASPTNQLADKEFVNSTVATQTAHYISDDGEPFTSVDDLPTEGVTNNDYAFVTGTDEAGNVYFDRYKASDNGGVITWAKEYRLNNSSFTANQWAAIQSGITSGLVAKLSALPTAEELAAALLEKYEKPTSGIPESDLSEGVKEKLNLKEIVYGYLHEGVFYKEIAHTTVIPAELDKQYTDITDAEDPVPYIWNGTKYVSIGGGGGDIYETVNLILSSDDESGVEIGADVTLTYADVTETKAYEEGGIRFQIPTSMAYKIDFEAEVGYIAPLRISRTAIAGNSITFEKQYQLNVTATVVLNQEITDAATMLSGDIDSEVVRWIRANSHRYLGKYTAEGEMSLCQLDDNNSNLYADGTVADLTGAEGDVFMKLPVFWWKCEKITGTTDQWNLILSRTAVEGFKKWDGDNELIGVYEAYSSNNKLYSRSGVGSNGSISQANFKVIARSRGQGFTIVTWEWNCIMAFLYYCLYGNMNCQALIGLGTNNDSKPTGQTNALGMADTRATVEGNQQSINFWGLENWWGNKWEWVDNVVVNATEVDDIWRIYDGEGNERTVAGQASASAESYIKSCVLGENFDLIPKSTGGSSTIGYCDAHWYTRSVGRVLLRGGSDAYVIGGVAAAAAAGDSSHTYASNGSRLAFHGNLEIVEDVSDFKSLTPIG